MIAAGVAFGTKKPNQVEASKSMPCSYAVGTFSSDGDAWHRYIEEPRRPLAGPARPLQSRLFIRGRDLHSAFSPAAIVTLSNRIRPAFRRWGAHSNGKARNGC